MGRSPKLCERYSWSSWAMAASMNNFVGDGDGDGNGYVGDVGLDPESAWTGSATWRWTSADTNDRVELTPFYTRFNDFIDAVPKTNFRDNQFNVLRYANQSARLWGINLAGQMRLGETERWGSLDVGARLEWQRGENRDSGESLYQQMPANAAFNLTQKRGAWSGTLEWELVDAKTRVSDVRNEIETAGYGLLHLRAAYTWTHVRIDAGVENLLDRNYDLPLGGAFVGQGTTMSLNAIPWGIAVPGAGRSVYAGLRMMW